MCTKTEKIYSAYVSKHNSNREKQVNLLMIPNAAKLWHYFSVKKLSASLRGITWKNNDDFIVGIVFIPLEQKKQTWITEESMWYNYIIIFL